MKRVLIAGIGNIFMGDDGFGCEVARRLASCDLPGDVELIDFGIRGIDLGYALQDGYEVVILIDAMQRGNAPGTVSLIDPDPAVAGPDGDTDAEAFSVHGMDPATVLRYVVTLGDRRPRLMLVACEPETLGGLEGFIGLSETVSAALVSAVRMVEELIAELCVPQQEVA